MPSRGSVLIRLGRLPFRATLAASIALLTTVVALVAVPASAAAAPAPLVGVGSNRCLDVTGNSNVNGALLEIWDCNGQANQGFEFTSAGELRVFNGTRCVDAFNAQTSPGTAVVIWDCNGGANQKWRHNADGTITGVQSGLCFDVHNQATANGAAVNLWNCNGQANQRWTRGGTNPTPTPTPTGGQPCTATPVDPQATAQARRLLCYLYSQYGNHIISGQQESTWVNGPDYEMNYIRNNTGKYPAIRGMDRGDSPDFGSRALSWWNSGGIPMVGYHMGSPAQGADGYSGSQMNANINAALTPGTADHNRFIQRLDGVAAELAKVQAGGGAVIWRPFHEAGGTWFWWSKEGGSQYVRLWRFTFDYMTKTKGLHNLVWLLPYNGEPQSSFYPGKAYVDVAGADTYVSDHGPLTSLFNSTRNIAGSTIPIMLHENGPIPDPDQLQSSATRWVSFTTWHTDWITNTGTNPISLLQKVYNSSYVVTRDEVPNLR